MEGGAGSLVPSRTATLDLPLGAWAPVSGMTACQYPMAPGPLERDRMYQHKVSLVVRYFMIPCNICLILLATSTLGFAVLLFLNNCRCLFLGTLGRNLGEGLNGKWVWLKGQSGCGSRIVVTFLTVSPG